MLNLYYYEELTLKEIGASVYKSIHNVMESSIFGIGLYDSESDTLGFSTSVFKGKAIPPFSIPARHQIILF